MDENYYRPPETVPAPQANFGWLWFTTAALFAAELLIRLAGYRLPYGLFTVSLGLYSLTFCVAVWRLSLRFVSSESPLPEKVGLLFGIGIAVLCALFCFLFLAVSVYMDLSPESD